MELKQKIISLSQQAGACSIGFADIVEVSQHWRQSFDSMVGEGRHGSMAFMERYRDIRLNPALLLEGASTLISLAFSYDKGLRHSRIASYALVQDYHFYLRQLLAPIIDFLTGEIGAECRICVDSAPVAERYWALRTGVGVKGRNQQLMVPGVGARVFLAEILTTAHIEPDPIVTYEGYADVCIGCDRCVRACPNGALEDPEKFDARRCVSYLTIEHRDSLPQGLNLAGKIYGCDICLDACPYNGKYTIAKDTIAEKANDKNANAKDAVAPIDILNLNRSTVVRSVGTPTQTTPQLDKEENRSDLWEPYQVYNGDLAEGKKGKSDSDKNFYSLQISVDSPFEIDTDILSLTTQDIENMTSGQYRRLTKKSAMSRCPLSQLKRNL